MLHFVGCPSRGSGRDQLVRAKRQTCRARLPASAAWSRMELIRWSRPAGVRPTLTASCGGQIQVNSWYNFRRGNLVSQRGEKQNARSRASFEESEGENAR